MIAEFRGGFFLAVAVGFLLFALILLALSAILRPRRWCERLKPVS